MDAKTVMHDSEDKMKKTLDVINQNFLGIRSGRANSSMAENIKVDYYGTQTPLKQMANITIPDPKTLMILPWDISALKAIEKAIGASDLGLNPANDGKVIRIPIPSLTEERRKELSRHVHKLAEEGRVHMRQVRHDLNKEIKSEEHEHALSEDDAKRLTVEVQKLTDRYVTLIDDLLKKKTTEVMED